MVPGTDRAISVERSPVPLFVKHARDAFRSRQRIEAEWRDLNFTAPPDLARAVRQYDAFAACLEAGGARVEWLPANDETGLDAIYTRDASVFTPGGMVLCRMGKPQRANEPDAQERAFRALGVEIAGRIEPPGTLEGGDVTWLDARTLVVGRGYRTNDAGIEQLRALVAGAVDEFVVVPLPHWRGAGDVFHLMSIISPIDRDLAVVYPPLLPVPFREWLLGRGIALVDVPDEEFDSMGANVLAIAPRSCLMIEGNPITRGRLHAAGATVQEYEGTEISLKGGGGPTCLTRPTGCDV